MVARSSGIHSEFGLWKCGKARVFPTFPQNLFFLFLNRFPKKITTKREGSAIAPKSLAVLLLGRFTNKLLTLRN